MAEGWSHGTEAKISITEHRDILGPITQNTTQRERLRKVSNNICEPTHQHPTLRSWVSEQREWRKQLFEEITEKSLYQMRTRTPQVLKSHQGLRWINRQNDTKAQLVQAATNPR